MSESEERITPKQKTPSKKRRDSTSEERIPKTKPSKVTRDNIHQD